VSAYKEDGLLPLEGLALVVEVANTTLRTDLGRKLRIYAEAGVPEYWAVDLRNDKLHQMWSPEGKAYREKREVALGDAVQAETIAGLRVETKTSDAMLRNCAATEPPLVSTRGYDLACKGVSY
jgi:hypothetical protein